MLFSGVARVSDQIASPDATDSSDMDEDMDDIDDLDEELEIHKNNKKRLESLEIESYGDNGCGKLKVDANNKRNKECESPTNTGIISFVDTTFWKKSVPIGSTSLANSSLPAGRRSVAASSSEGRTTSS